MKGLIAIILTVMSGAAIAQPTTADQPTTTSSQPAAAAPTDPKAATNDAACKTAMQARFDATALAGIKDTQWCPGLAVAVADSLYNAQKVIAATKPATNPNQPTITDTPGAQSSAGQTAAVASGQPVASAGGSIGAVGSTGQGLELVTALAINPGTLATGDTDPRTVWLSRFVDLSVVLPANLDPADGLTKGFTYVGGRLRLNLMAAIHAGRLEQKLAAAVKKYTTVQAKLTDVVAATSKLLAAAPDPVACALAIEAHDSKEQTSSCAGTLDEEGLGVAGTDARASLEEFRAEADSHYLSVEARYDRGDLNADMAGRKDNLLAAYVSGGYTWLPTSDGTSFGLRLRGGAVFFEDGATRDTKFAGYASVGVELGVVRDLKRYTFSAGFDVYSQNVSDDPMVAMDQHNAFKFGLGVPVADGKTVSVGLSVPIDTGDPIIAISGDWSLLLDGAK